MQSFSVAPWADIIRGPAARARLAGRLTVVGVLLTVLGALCLSAPLIMLLAQTPVWSPVRAAPSEDTAQLEAAARWDRALLDTPQLAVGNAADPFDPSGQPAYATDTAYQALLGTGDPMARIRIPKLGLSLDIGHGTGAGTLETGAGHVYGTTLPVGDPGNSVIAGHRGLGLSLLFYRLGELGDGDLVYTQAAGRTIAWRVTAIHRVDPGSAAERRLLAADGRRTLLTLYTCDPPGLNTRRLVITCRRVPYVETVSVPGQTDWSRPALAAAGTALAATVVYLVFHPVSCAVRHARRRRD